MSRHASILFFVVVALVAVVFNKTNIGNNFSARISSLASLFYGVTSTPEQLRSDYTTRKIKILLVPGHDNEFWGTEYQGTKEADLNLAMAEKIRSFFDVDDRFDISITRGIDGNYEPWFVQYVKDHDAEVSSWEQEQKKEFTQALANGFVTREEKVVHNDAPSSVARYLYAINKYSSENDIDLVLHIHFNDYSGRRQNAEGKYTGFAIYVPEGQFPNASSSTAVAEAIRSRLASYFAGSNMPDESSAVIPDQDLIAVGANGTQKKAALLVEYGYIYESQFSDPAVRDILLTELAGQTYAGVIDFFEAGKNSTTSRNSSISLLPHVWSGPIVPSEDRTTETLSLQAALHSDGLYPPTGETLNDCPVSGKYGACTRKAVKAFQEKFADTILAPMGLNVGTGVAGPRTIAVFNKLYSK
ncbi:MAG: peptidoglycan-binding protein [Candidatus Vogelbacteria bacterium]|nr:peptidoglycan-binding protein [Candidatus Vogelbacteria bacterium]